MPVCILLACVLLCVLDRFIPVGARLIGIRLAAGRQAQQHDQSQQERKKLIGYLFHSSRPPISSYRFFLFTAVCALDTDSL